MKRLITKQEGKALGFLLPTVLLLAIFFIWPIVLSFYYSMTNMTLSVTS